MANTVLSDLVVPEVFTPYMIEQTSVKSAVLNSGIVRNVTGAAGIVDMGGHEIKMPSFEDLTGDDSVAAADGTALVPGKIGTQTMVVPVLNRERAFSANALAGAMAGTNPIQAIGSLISSYRARQLQKAVINTLDGAMAAVTANVSDITASSGAASKFNAETFLDAQYKLGDHFDKLGAVMVHSATKKKMEKDNLIDFSRDSDGNEMVTYRGKPVIVDDGLTVSSGDYTSYIIGMGALNFAELSVPNAFETYREELENNDGLIQRRRYALSIPGVSYTGTLDGTTPTNAALATSGNWTLVYEAQNVPVVQFIHKL